MARTKDKKFISIRAKLFLQVGAVILIAIGIILALNNFLLPEIYTVNEKRTMKEVCKAIDKLDYTSDDYQYAIASYEKENSFSIDVFLADGTPVYNGAEDIFDAAGKVTITKKENFDNFEYLDNVTEEQMQKNYLLENCAGDKK